MSESWETIHTTSQLGDLIETLESGRRPKGGVDQIRDGIPSIGGEHINAFGGFDFAKIKFIPKDFYEEMQRGKVKKGDILIVKDGATTGKVALVTQDFPYDEAAVNEHVFIVRPLRSRMSPEFLFYYMYSPFGQAQISANFHGSAQGGINSQFIHNFEVPTPSMEKQEAIVSILNRTHNLSLKREQANQLTSRIIESAFLEMFGDPVSNPKGWKERTLGDVLVGSPQNGLFKKNEFYGHGTPIVWVENLFDRYILETEGLRQIELSNQEIDKYALGLGDILLCRSSLPVEGVGKMVVVPQLKEHVVFESHVMKLNVVTSQVLPYFVIGFYNSQPGRRLVLKKARIATMTTINQEDIKSLKIFTPPLELQRKFEGVVKRVCSIMSYQKISAAQINELFQSLLHKAFRINL